VATFDQRATLDDPHTVRLADGSTHTAKHILIATGGPPERPGMPNDHLGIVSDDIFNLETLPKSLLIVGGGYIACEFACIMNGLGVEVTQFYRGAQILRGFDGEARGLIAEMMEERASSCMSAPTSSTWRPPRPDHEASRTGRTDAAMGAPADVRANRRDRRNGGPVWVKASNGQEACSMRSFSPRAAGPTPTGHGPGRGGRRGRAPGQVVVDAYSQTAVPSIYAIGDVTNRVNLTPVAIREGMAFVETVFNGNPTPVDHDLIPSAVFTQPEFGTVGLSEEEAREQEPGGDLLHLVPAHAIGLRGRPTGC
jgi:glutathione reductase (NADPH)